MRKFASLLLFFICTVSMTAIYAGGQSNAANTDLHWNHHAGFYAEGGAGTNLYYLGVFSSVGSVSQEGFVGWGWNAAIGYNFNYRWALEAGFIQSYANFKDADGNSEYTNADLPYLAARYAIPIRDNFSFLFKFGLMYAHVNLKDNIDGDNSSPSITLPYFGLGMAYAITPKLDVTVQYQGFVYGIVGAGLLSTGLTYHFS